MRFGKSGNRCDSQTAARRPDKACWVAMLAVSVLFLPGAALAAQKGDLQVAADYRIKYSGVKIGSFQFSSTIRGRRYHLTSQSRVKIFFGAFRWSSQSTTNGILGRTAEPQSFDFSYKIKKKRKSASVRFNRGDVVSVKNTPPVNYTKKYVPLRPEHLKDVLDPMTAIMRMTRGKSGQPCRQSAEIFDGKRRLRLSLSPKGKRSIKERHASGQPGFGYVCRIRFAPVAGHKRNSHINHLAKSRDMEIVLRPVPSANLLVPYEIVIPTMVGTVSITARSINIVNGSKQRIAMRR